MVNTIPLQIPEDLYSLLVQAAAKTDTTPEELALQWLVAALKKAEDDPVEEFIGAFSSSVPDWVEHHDNYLGQAMIESSNNA